MSDFIIISILTVSSCIIIYLLVDLGRKIKENNKDNEINHVLEKQMIMLDNQYERQFGNLKEYQNEQLNQFSSKVIKNLHDEFKIIHEINNQFERQFGNIKKHQSDHLSQFSSEIIKSLHEEFKIIHEINKQFERQFGNIKKHQSDHLSQFSSEIIKSLHDEFKIIHEINKQFERQFGNIKKYQNETLNEFNIKVMTQLRAEFKLIHEEVSKQLEKINNKVDDRLKEGFNKTNETFNNILQRLSKIDEAQKKIESLSTNIISLQDILTDKKSRGTFGEIQLQNILESIFGENNTQIFELQKKLSNNYIADAVLFTPEPLGTICIDSKFPLENYKVMTDRTKSDQERTLADRKFKRDVKKHIDDIHNKYIIPNETTNQAIMFIPAEAVFAEINAYHSDIIEYSQRKQVWMTSPTTLMSMLTTVQVILRNMERDKYSAIIHDELNKLGEEFNRYRIRWDNLSKHIDTVSKDVKEIHVTTNKITKEFNKISTVNIKKDNELETKVLKV